MKKTMVGMEPSQSDSQKFTRVFPIEAAYRRQTQRDTADELTKS